ncbi:T9SS type A sorting domain-containing protein [Algibacter mikhailovii]|uniref:T9SS type A sorting domain-containing protein n=1 Tax=Algibacter mikhailovii TaxID=425498 RepID=UPI002494CBD3|nr:T9SS type A sorting domain-containing protein [Algibacter mikhailovii]
MIKKYSYIKIILLFFLVCFVRQMQGQTVTVNSLEDLLTYLDDDNVEVTLAAGTYSITPEDITAGTFSNPLLLFEGSNSTYNFDGATINIDTNVLRSFGNVDVNEIQILGNGNVIKNLTIEDIGTAHPTKRAQSIVIDGKDNLIEGMHLTLRGSYPYGYGDAFGKGGGSVIGHKKHSGVLIRGLRNHLKDSDIISRSYGHIVFMQAASYPVIEGCYIEGEMRTTDDMLAEEGTGSPADKVDFQTVWGYRLPAGYMMSLQEGGIRAYNAGTTYIDGVEIQRGTDNPTILNCTIKNARTGVTLAHATGTKYVEGVSVLGCEQGYSIGSGTVTNCSGDAQYGPVLSFAYSSDKNTNVDITVLPANDYYNGSGTMAYIGGHSHNITLHGGDPNSNLRVQVGGQKNNVRLLGVTSSQNPLTASNLVLHNLTESPVVLDDMSSNVTGTSCGMVNDSGSENLLLSCDDNPEFPDENAIYLINNPRWNARLGANGAEELLMLAETEAGANAQWKFTPVAGEPGYYFIDCIGGGVKPRVSADAGVVTIMQASTFTDDSAKWRLDVYEDDLFHITNKNGRRLRGFDTIVDVVATSSSGSYTRFSFSKLTLRTSGEKLIENVSIYPIPTSDVLHIEFKNSVTANVSILDLTGKILVTQHIEGSSQLKMSHLPSGIYMVRIQTEEAIFNEKVIRR